MSDMRLGMLIDLAKCIGCNACVVACRLENETPLTKFNTWIESWDVEDGNGYVRRSNVPKQCNHCDNPACVDACPTGRTVKDAETGLVYHDPEINCAGAACQLCVEACPYHHPVYIEDLEKVVKCDGCRDLVAKGEQPACVASCMMRALHFGPVDELRAQYGDDLVSALPCYPDGETGPNFLVKARACALEDGFEEKTI